MTASWFHRKALEATAAPAPKRVSLTEEEFAWIVSRAEERGAFWALREALDSRAVLDPVGVCERARGNQ